MSWFFKNIFWHLYRTYKVYIYIHCVKSVCIRGYSGPDFRAFGLNAERYSISFCIHFKCGKMRTKIIPSTDTFYAVIHLYICVYAYTCIYIYANNINICIHIYLSIYILCIYIIYVCSCIYIYIHIYIYIYIHVYII